MSNSTDTNRLNGPKYVLLLFFLAGAVTMIVMSRHFFQHEISGILTLKPIAAQAWFRWLFKLHILCGIVAICVGPIQFLIPRRRPNRFWHKPLGYVYVGAVAISATTGLWVAQYAMGGMMATIGFSLLAVGWFSTTLLAVMAIRNGNIELHRKWTFLSYGLTFAAIPQRTMLLIPLFTTVEFIEVYKLSAWLPWLFNTWVALYLYRRLAVRAEQAQSFAQ